MDSFGRRMFRPRGGAGWRWAIYSLLSGAASLGAFFPSGVGFQQTEPFVDLPGLWQRICVLIGWTWLTVLALRLLRERRPRSPHVDAQIRS